MKSMRSGKVSGSKTNLVTYKNDTDFCNILITAVFENGYSLVYRVEESKSERILVLPRGPCFSFLPKTDF